MKTEGSKGILDGLKDKIPGNTPTNKTPIISTDTSTSTPTNKDTDKNTDGDTDTDNNINTDKEIITDTTISTNKDTKEVTIKKQLKYLEKRSQRAYYLENNVIKNLDKISKKYNVDKSDIVNEALKLFLDSIKKE